MAPEDTTLESGLRCKDTGQYSRAAEIFTALLPAADKTRKGFIYRELAFVLEKLNRRVEMIEALKKALEVDEGDGDALEMLGRALRSGKETDKALFYLQKALAAHRGRPDKLFLIHGELAGLYHDIGDDVRALAEVQEALKYRSDDLRMNREIASVLFALGRGKQAAEEIGNFISKAGRGQQVYREMASLCFDNGEPELAASCLKSLLGELKETETFERNKTQNRIEYLEKKTVLGSKPLRLMACLTRECNLGCIMCYDKYRKQWEIPEAAVREIESYFPYLEYAQWRGGEVFLYKNFKALFDKAALYPRLCQDIVTNGTLIDEEWAEKIIRTGTKLSLSIDGVHKETYEKIRRGAKFEEITRTLKLLKHYRASVTKPKFKPELFMNFVVLRSNYKDVEDIVDFAAQNGIEFVQTVAGDTADFPASDEHKQEDITKDPEIIAYLQQRLPLLHEKAKKYGVRFRNFFPEDACVPIDERGSAPAVFIRPTAPRKIRPAICRAPWDSLFVFLFDTVKPHCFCDAVIGDLKTGPLSAMWNGEVMQNYRKKVGANDTTGFCSARCLKQEPFENMGLNL